MIDKALMSNEDYHADTTAISKSGLDQIAKSPSHYWEAYLNPDRPPREVKEHFVEGSLFHTVNLELHKLHDEFFVLPSIAPSRPTSRQIHAKDPSDETRKAIEFWRGVDSAAKGKQLISQEQLDVANAMRDSLIAHPAARQLIEMQGVVEQATFFIEPATGAPCKIKPDKKVPSEGIVIDLKSTDDASHEGFAKSCAKFRYHVQDPFYRNGLNEAAGRIQYTDFFFIAVEKHPPYRVAVYQLDKAAKALGTQLYQENCETYVWCRDNNKWPAYSPFIETLGLPGWAFSNR